VIRHRTAKLQALEAGSQAERLRLPDLDDKMPVPGHLIQHHALEGLLRQRRSEADDLGDPHLDEADIGTREHGGFPSRSFGQTMARCQPRHRHWLSDHRRALTVTSPGKVRWW
jgi:hypothetical protein